MHCKRDTPRGSIHGFLEACEAFDFERAAKYLDLRNLPGEVASLGGPELARQFKHVLSRAVWLDDYTVSDDPEGLKGDGLPPYRDELVASKRGKVSASSGCSMSRVTTASSSGKFPTAAWRCSRSCTTNTAIHPGSRQFGDGFPKGLRFLVSKPSSGSSSCLLSCWSAGLPVVGIALTRVFSSRPAAPLPRGAQDHDRPGRGDRRAARDPRNAP